jgi:hypothetical protein
MAECIGIKTHYSKHIFKVAPQNRMQIGNKKGEKRAKGQKDFCLFCRFSPLLFSLCIAMNVADFPAFSRHQGNEEVRTSGRIDQTSSRGDRR